MNVTSTEKEISINFTCCIFIYNEVRNKFYEMSIDTLDHIRKFHGLKLIVCT